MGTNDLTTFETGAQRIETAIPPYSQIPPCVVRRLAMIYAEGELKYGRDNWKKGIPWYSTYNHVMEHLQKYQEGDRSEDHLAKALWGIGAQMYFDDEEHAEATAMKNLNELAGMNHTAQMIASTTTKRELYERPLVSQKPQRAETHAEYLDRRTAEIMGTIEDHRQAAVSDFHDPGARASKDVVRLQLEYNLRMAADRLEYGQGAKAVREAAENLIHYELDRGSKADLRSAGQRT